MRWALSVDEPHVGPHAEVDPHLTQQVQKGKKKKTSVWVRWALHLSTGAQGLAVKNPCSTRCAYLKNVFLRWASICRWASRWTTPKGGSKSDATSSKHNTGNKLGMGAVGSSAFYRSSGRCGEKPLLNRVCICTAQIK